MRLQLRGSYMTMNCMCKVTAFVLLLMLGAMASGVPQYFHEQGHEREEAAELKGAEGAGASENVAGGTGHSTHKHEHSDQDCPICAQFHAPMMAASVQVWLLDSGEWVRFVSMLAVNQRSQTFGARISCRGPPASNPIDVVM